MCGKMFCSHFTKMCVSSSRLVKGLDHTLQHYEMVSNCHIRTLTSFNLRNSEDGVCSQILSPYSCKHQAALLQGCLLQTKQNATSQKNIHIKKLSSGNHRQVRTLSKHYPSTHFTRLRRFRHALRRVIQRNSKFERRRLSDIKMKDRVKEGVGRMRGIVHENIFTIPNVLSTSRLVLSPVLGYLVVTEQYPLATGLFIFTGATDLLDGYIARNFKNQMSALGSIIDPLADKCLISILTVSLTVSSLIPVPLTVLILGRDIGLVGAAFYMRYRSLTPPITLSRYFDVSHATIQLKPTFISKVNTAVQLLLVGVTLPAPIFHYVDHISLQYLWCLTAATTILSGMSYIFSKNTVEFLKSSQKKQ